MECPIVPGIGSPIFPSQAFKSFLHNHVRSNKVKYHRNMWRWLKQAVHQQHLLVEPLPVIKLITSYYVEWLLLESLLTGGGNVIKEKHRVVIMGSAFVGKTQIVSQFLYDKFTSRYRQTIEELHRGEYELPDQSSLILDILDTSGAFAFPAMRDLSISTSNGFLLVFSIDNEESWKEVSRLREKVRKAINRSRRKCFNL